MSHIKESDFKDFTSLYCFKTSKSGTSIKSCLELSEDSMIMCNYSDGSAMITVYAGKKVVSSKSVSNIRQLIKRVDKAIHSSTNQEDEDFGISVKPKSITAAINTKDLANKLVRVKSSNVWAYGMNIRKRGNKIGDVITQFKGTDGGPGDVYIYYDVPIRVYQRWQSAPSKGHFFWQYLRNNYKYSKLTGDKKGKLPNAVN